MEEPKKREASGGRHGYQAFIFCLLLVVWVVFSGLFDLFHLSLGVVSSALVTWISSDLLFRDRAVPLHRRIRQGLRLSGYLFWLMGQVVLANNNLLRLSLAGKRAIHPRIVRYRTELQSDFEKYLLANSITLTPGTVTMKIIGQTFYIHAIGDHAARSLDGEMDRRIARIFN